MKKLLKAAHRFIPPLPPAPDSKEVKGIKPLETEEPLDKEPEEEYDLEDGETGGIKKAFTWINNSYARVKSGLYSFGQAIKDRLTSEEYDLIDLEISEGKKRTRKPPVSKGKKSLDEYVTLEADEEEKILPWLRRLKERWKKRAKEEYVTLDVDEVPEMLPYWLRGISKFAKNIRSAIAERIQTEDYEISEGDLEDLLESGSIRKTREDKGYITFDIDETPELDISRFNPFRRRAKKPPEKVSEEETAGLEDTLIGEPSTTMGIGGAGYYIPSFGITVPPEFIDKVRRNIYNSSPYTL